MSTRPEVINICGRPWDVIEQDLSLHSAAGVCDTDQQRILLHPDQPLVGEQDTVLHEVLHAILRQQGRPYTKAEELHVTALAPGLLSVLQENPALVRYLTKKKRR